ncbi:DUF1016 domain-containing protein [Pseudomonas capeferrum]|nr:DUF1016 domain-containing protein [Pseudomonas capeferrum]
MSDTPVSLSLPLQGYGDWLADLKGRIHDAQQRAALAVNRELVLLYWQIGLGGIGIHHHDAYRVLKVSQVVQ